MPPSVKAVLVIVISIFGVASLFAFATCCDPVGDLLEHEQRRLKTKPNVASLVRLLGLRTVIILAGGANTPSLTVGLLHLLLRDGENSFDQFWIIG